VSEPVRGHELTVARQIRIPRIYVECRMVPLTIHAQSQGMADFEQLRRTHEANRYDFVRAEIELAITFAEAAVTSDSKEKTKRNTEHARRAYQAAQRFMHGARLTPEMDRTLGERVDRLRDLLAHL
jgi:hypothetical protein